jgi:Tol biopolymer transport system component
MFTSIKSFLFALLLCTETFALGTIQSGSIPSIDQTIDSLFAAQTFEQVAISPDGKQVAWVQTLQGQHQMPSPNSAIYVASVGGSLTTRRITAGNGTTAYAEHDIAWAPNSKQLAFLSDRTKRDQLELYVADVAGSAARRLTNLTGFLADPQWSPDGKMLAFLFTENAPRAAGPLEPMTPASGVVEEHVYEQRFTTIDLATNRVAQVSPADLYVYEYDWSPDGKSAVIAAHGAGDANWCKAQLHRLAIGLERSSRSTGLRCKSLCRAGPRMGDRLHWRVHER